MDIRHLLHLIIGIRRLACHGLPERSAQPAAELIAKPVPVVPVKDVTPFRISITAQCHVHVIAHGPIIAEMAQISAACAFPECRRYQSGTPSPFAREDAKRQRKDRNIGDIEKDRPGDHLVAYDHLHRRTAEIVMRVLQVARREDPVLHEEDIRLHLFDLLAVVQSLFNLRLAEIDLPLLALEVVRNCFPVIHFTSVDQFRNSLQFLPRGVGRIDGPACIEERGRPVDIDLLRFEGEILVVDIRLAEEIHRLAGESINDGIGGRVRHDRINAGGGLDRFDRIGLCRCGVTRHNGTVQRDGSGVRSRGFLCTQTRRSGRERIQKKRGEEE